MPNQEPRGRVQFFRTCLVNDFLPEAGIAAVELLERAGFEVEVPRGQTCCGQPAWNAGFRDEARAVARRAVGQLARTKGPIVVPSGSCADMLAHQTEELFRGDPEWRAAARSVAGRVRELTQFLVGRLPHPSGATAPRPRRPLQEDQRGGEPAEAAGARSSAREAGSEGLRPGTVQRTGPTKVAYHASCHLLRGLGVRDAPVELLRAREDLELVPLGEVEECCGFGGTFAVTQARISGAMLDRKCRAIERSGAQAVASCDAGCLLQIAGGLHRRGSAVHACHVAELLAGRPP